MGPSKVYAVTIATRHGRTMVHMGEMGAAVSDEQKEMKDKDEITDLGEALVAIIQSPPGTWVDSSGSAWRWDRSMLQWFDADDGPKWIEGDLNVLDGAMPLRRIRYGWVPCEYEEAHQLPDGSRAFMGHLWDHSGSPVFSVDSWPSHVREGGHWVKWGRQ